MEQKQKRTELSEIGEFGLIDRIKSKFTLQHEASVKGIGDDAAVVDAGEKFLLISTDMLVEGIHFDLSYVPIRHLGYKAVAVNVSDIAAMNGIPKQITVSIAISNRFSLEAIEAFYEGVKFACENYRVDLVGGDTTSSTSGFIVSVSILGEVEKENICYRSGARPNDIICATGDLGAAYVGLQVLEREKQVFLSNPDMQPELSGYDYLVQRQLKPEARMDLIHELKEMNLAPSAMMDISDGLASELLHIATSSEVGISIYEDKLPIDKSTFDTAVEFKLDPITCALNGGEDYELLFTIRQDDYEKIKKHPDIAMIGYVTQKEQGNVFTTKSGNTVGLKAQGWQHFQ
ncbi:thiamine-phosphate kinase [Fulvivirgaceae bacterium BMA10]|uniref:Thiamine-monophosphate kinase n=1 Tax=Splendidivirga corallicola TaxID=3051826 RepID=A0ABT8KLI2_9BACT|nr:thiamine-phosphate kinase [Fulvivirgaceae bacterium BMA10]